MLLLGHVSTDVVIPTKRIRCGRLHTGPPVTTQSESGVVIELAASLVVRTRVVKQSAGVYSPIHRLVAVRRGPREHSGVRGQRITAPTANDEAAGTKQSVKPASQPVTHLVVPGWPWAPTRHTNLPPSSITSGSAVWNLYALSRSTPSSLSNIVSPDSGFWKGVPTGCPLSAPK